MKKKTKKELKEIAKLFLGKLSANSEVEAVVNGYDPDVMIDPMTGKIWYWADLADQQKISQLKS